MMGSGGDFRCSIARGGPTMLILGDTGSWDVRRARSRVRVEHTEVCKVVGKGGGGKSFTHKTWVGLVSSRRLRPVPDIGAGCARSVQSWERATWFLTSALDVHVGHSLGRGWLTRPTWSSSVGGDSARFLISALKVHVVYSRGREVFTRPREARQGAAVPPGL
jgi:hypothetical protein